MKRRGILIVVSGFSGAGKGTLMKRLLAEYDNYALSVSMTTRRPREGEINGVSYFFVDREAFEREIENDGLIEYANYCGSYYGTPREYVERCLEEGKDVVLEIEIQGALKVKEKFPEALLLFVLPPSAQELRRRLEGRGTESAEVIQSRLERAAEEAQGMEQYEYLIVNDDLEACVREMHSIIQAARCNPLRQKQLIADMRTQLEGLVKGQTVC